MLKIISKSLCMTLCVFACGCVKETFGPELEYEEEQAPRARLEAIPPQVEILDQVRKTPTEFVMPVSESRYAWERAELFFKKHTAESQFSAGKGDAIILSNPGKSERINYAVERRSIPAGPKFSVRCSANSGSVPQEEINIQCRNLARFIRDGVLEETFINR